MAKKKPAVRVKTDTKLQDYELIYIINPEISEEALETKVNGIGQFITSREGVISSVDKWGKKKLAYPLKHFLEGIYILTKFKMSPAHCKELESSLTISEEILRHLLVKAEG